MTEAQDVERLSVDTCWALMRTTAVGRLALPWWSTADRTSPPQLRGRPGHRGLPHGRREQGRAPGDDCPAGSD